MSLICDRKGLTPISCHKTSSCQVDAENSEDLADLIQEIFGEIQLDGFIFKLHEFPSTTGRDGPKDCWDCQSFALVENLCGDHFGYTLPVTVQGGEVTVDKT